MFYLRRYGFVLLVLVAILFPFIFYSSEMTTRKEVSLVERVVYAVTSPVQWIFSITTNGVSHTLSSYVDLRTAKESAISLQDENARLQVKMQVLKELELENIRLRELLNFVKHVDLQFVSGEIKSADPTFLYKSMRLSRGEADGVRPGMAVVAAEGAVGVVMRTADKSCDVLLVTDPNSDLDVIVVRNRRRGIVEGNLGRNLRFKYSDRGTRVQVGDEIISSGLTGAFPRGITVGKVSKIGIDTDGVSQTIEVEPAVDFSHLSEALILLQPSREVETIRKVGGDIWMKGIMESVPSSKVSSRGI